MTKKLNEYLGKCSEEYSDKELDETFKNSSIERLKEILKKNQEKPTKDLKEATGLNNKSTTYWYDKNKFNEILTTVDNNNFNSNLMTLITWSTILKIMQLVNQMLKRK